mgnify:CR=1 FL=1
MSSNRSVPGAWRMGMRILAAAAWLLVLGLAFHESSDPTVLDRWSVGWARLVAAAGAGALALSLLVFPGPLVRLYGIRLQIMALVMMALLGLGLMEGAIRAFDIMGVSYYEEAKRYHLEKIADDDLIYTHRPSWSSRYQSVDVSFNEYGFRDDPIVEREPDELRILFLGDSVTFGWGVAQDAIFAARLEKLLSEELGRPVVVVNTGVGSYNTVQQRAVVERFGERLLPDIVLLLYVYNDTDEHERPFDPFAQFEFANYSFSGKVQLILGHSWLYRLVQHVREQRGSGAREGGTLGATERSAGWLASIAALDDIGRWTRDRDLPFATYVWRRSAAPSDRLWTDLVEAGGRGGFPVVEASPAWVDVSEYRLSQVDGHPNASGHKLLAEALARDLRKRGWLPAPR